MDDDTRAHVMSVYMCVRVCVQTREALSGCSGVIAVRTAEKSVGGLWEKLPYTSCDPAESAIFMAYLPFIIIGPVLLLLPSTFYPPTFATVVVALFA